MKRPLVIALALALLIPLIPALQAPQPAAAADAGLWNPGYIISDSVFYDGNALSASNVQSFLHQRVSSCVSGYTCLKDYKQNTPDMPGSSLCAPYSGASNERASDIIAKVGAACSINPKALLVLLEKEQSLVTSRSPSAGRYAAATGFSCPDTAPCDPAFEGFFYQVYYAARQFQNYAATPSQWNYQAGRVNNILYHPNPACGTSPVFIQNKATAALYIYTPYQPNGAALSNLYGEGDHCSTYGNRNFWRIFSDWFGSPIEASSLLRTIDNATVYLVSGNSKHPISSMAVLTALSPLGQVGYVSQQYLDTLTTKHTVGRSLRDPAGTIYFYDAGIKLPFTSCQQAVDYGASCADTGYVQLTDVQAAAFVTGPVLSSVLGTVDGARYYIKDGSKAEILDAQSQLDAGISSAGMNVLTENAVAHLDTAAPVIRSGVYVQERASSRYSVLAGGSRYLVSPGDEAALGVPARTVGKLWGASLAKVPSSPITFGGLASVADASLELVTADGRYALSAGAVPANAAPVPLDQALIESYPDRGAIAEGTFIKAPDRASVFVVMPTDVRPISSWEALLALTLDGQPKILTVPQALIDSVRTGPVALTAGSLVRSPENATVYYINGVTNRIALSSFDFTAQAGIHALSFAPEAIIQAYPMAPQLMTFGLQCEADRYVSAGGQVHLVDPALVSSYPFDFVPLDRFSCAQLSKGSPATPFIRTPNGSLYHLMNGEKRPIGTMARFAELAGTQGYLNVVPRFADAIPTGPAA